MEQDKEQLLVALNNFLDDAKAISVAINSMERNPILHAVPDFNELHMEIYDLRRKYEDVVLDNMNWIHRKAIAHLTNLPTDDGNS